MRTRHDFRILSGMVFFILFTCLSVSAADEKWYLGSFDGKWNMGLRYFTLIITEETDGLAVVYEYGAATTARPEEEKRFANKANWRGRVVSDKKIIIGVAPDPVITVSINESGEITAKWEWKNEMPNYSILKKR